MVHQRYLPSRPKGRGQFVLAPTGGPRYSRSSYPAAVRRDPLSPVGRRCRQRKVQDRDALSRSATCANGHDLIAVGQVNARHGHVHAEHHGLKRHGEIVVEHGVETVTHSLSLWQSTVASAIKASSVTRFDRSIRSASILRHHCVTKAIERPGPAARGPSCRSPCVETSFMNTSAGPLGGRMAASSPRDRRISSGAGQA
jgi:hypothetical protein